MLNTTAHSEQVHPTAIVEPGARLEPGAAVGPFCHVGSRVSLGAGTRLVSHVVIDGDTAIGADCTLYPFVTVGLPPQDLKYRGEPTRTEIGPGCVLREHVTIHRGTVTGTGVTRVGRNCLLMAVVHVAHDCDIGDNVIIANNVVMGGHVTIEPGARIMGSAALHQFVRIGAGALVGGVTGVERDVIPYGSVLGNRARLVGLNWIGLRRSGAPADALQRLRRAFRTLFPRIVEPGAAFAERLVAVRAEYGDDPKVAEILAFIDAGGRRGLVPAATRLAEEDDADLA
jgi:UDP-N-acetylglucosamine acyltransferase